MHAVHEISEPGGAPDLLERAATGEAAAWRELVDRNTAVVWAAARAYSPTAADAEDVCQVTWLLLAENLGSLRDPRALPGWLATTARREAVRLSKARHRESPVDWDTGMFDIPDHADGPEVSALRSVAVSRMWQAFAQMSRRCQQLLRVVAVAPDASYAQVSQALGMPRGSIGPKKGRCLAALRERLATGGVVEEAAG
ncbi:RNA polymerase sigma factor [Saccharopolyspora gloriosae]|uniref:RNA polymerase sigma factor n=1 Tax=Saccharopolyspora gloriosae TaxID=455344 RepID=UPI001FB7A270|nr:sigma-70 family RNA polymerase sigma factor [Saccharopolyspora gloriosae]